VIRRGVWHRDGDCPRGVWYRGHDVRSYYGVEAVPDPSGRDGVWHRGHGTQSCRYAEAVPDPSCVSFGSGVPRPLRQSKKIYVS